MNQAQQLESVRSRHVDIGDQAIDPIEIAACKQLCGGVEELDRVVSGIQKVFERAEDALVVVYYCDDKARRTISHRVYAKG